MAENNFIFGCINYLRCIRPNFNFRLTDNLIPEKWMYIQMGSNKVKKER